MRHRKAHPHEIEARFRAPVEPVVAHRLPEGLQAQLAEGLEATRQAHHRVHATSATLTEAIAHQSDLRFTARQQLTETIAAAAVALEVLQ
jgi:hypothetical protein